MQWTLSKSIVIVLSKYKLYCRLVLKFRNTYSKLPENFYARVNPAHFSQPSLIRFNIELASQLGIDSRGYSEHDIAQIFAGQKILPGSEPLAMAYAGFQFGHPVPQLGDGRAHLLGEVNGYDIQLKGSGQTPFSRQGDGRSALGPVLREYIVSEAMHALGVPTTRALCAVTTGEDVMRQYGAEPGGIFTRVADGHIRVGTFQYFAFKEDIESIKILLEYTIKRHYPELQKLDTISEKALALLIELTKKQSDLIAKWTSYGFIHGVMNTDNFSLSGITIDYGPCAFMDEFKFHKVFSSIDRNGRYSFFNQVPIAQWNILRLADTLLPLIHKDQNEAIKIVEEKLIPLFSQFEFKRMQAIAKKLGIDDYTNVDEHLVMSFLEYLEKESIDFTLAFRNLPKLYQGDKAFYKDTIELNEFIGNWKKRVKSIEGLNEINPYIIPRNHQIEQAIDLAYKGDYSHFNFLVDKLSFPFQEDQDGHKLSLPPHKDERVYQTFCGT
jgi:uncharacterized protein YdiU (UPF0061 family)